MEYTKEQIRIGAEKAFILDLITNKFPKGIVSYVSDSFDLWAVVTKILPSIKEEILQRDGKLVIRPDSGDPVDIICGIAQKYQDISKYFPKGEVLPEYFEDYLLEEVSEETPHGERGVEEYSQIYIINDNLYKATIHNISWNRHDKQYYFIDMWEKADITIEKLEFQPSDKGVIELLWDIFGGTVNEQGYKVLDPHIGAIYGDSINLERQLSIYRRLAAKGFAATNIVLGVGSFTYVMLTRDSAGYAAKGSWFEVKEDYKKTSYNIYKEPITGDGTKKSLKGLMKVYYDGSMETYQKLGKPADGTPKPIVVKEECNWVEEAGGLLQTIYEDGGFYNQTTLTEIRERIQNG